MAEYFLIAETSAVTLTIAGVVKEVVTIVVSLNICLLVIACCFCSNSRQKCTDEYVGMLPESN